MAKVIFTVRIMPESPDVDVKKIETEALKVITKFAGDSEKRVKVSPFAFGLNSIDITFILDESLGTPDDLEAQILKIAGVNSYQVTDCRRAIG
ncbi:MAG TPA: hypothetical protein VK158_04015 [Acidobacteriota bacterium]|nr:hypothetical protein [Acidobacteriota bacterium]